MNKHFLLQEQTSQCTLSALPKFDSPPRRASSGLDKGSFPVQLNLHFTDTHSIQTPHYYRQFDWSLGKKKHLDTDTPLI